MINVKDLLLLLALCGIVFLSYFLYGILRKKRISVATAVKHCNLFWAGALVLFFIGCCVNPSQSDALNAVPGGAMALIFAVLLCLFYVVVYGIGLFSAMLLRKLHKEA